MLKKHAIAIAGLMLFVSVLGGSVVLADIIDGHWCSGDGRRLKINGNILITPGGRRIRGEYDRHHFVFTVPASEPNGGKDVDLVLVTPDVAHLRYMAGSDERSETTPEIWTRCKEPLSGWPLPHQVPVNSYGPDQHMARALEL